MKRALVKAGLNALIFTINLQLKNKHLSDWARKELEDDKADLEKELARQRRSSKKS
jgi:hypothetical protein